MFNKSPCEETFDNIVIRERGDENLSLVVTGHEGFLSG